MTYIDLGGPGCVRLKYLSAEEGIALNVSYGDSVLHSQRVKGPDPAPTCLSMFARLAQMCARFKELLPTDDGMRGCLQLEPMLLGEVQIELPLGCFRMGPKGVELIKSSEDEIQEQQPVESAESTPLTADEKKEDDEPAKPIAPAANVTSPLSLLDNLSTADILAAVSESTDEGIAMISNWLGLGINTKPAGGESDSTAETNEKNETSDSS
ncbi:AAEL013537-PA [Aedes aegypti]|nr:AAEL013537-PA [Aedes aegypti]